MAHCGGGPGYASPMDAFLRGPREKLLYTVCVQPDLSQQDYLATLDVDPESPTYCQVIHRTYTGSSGDELHHSGWNVCSSCHHDPNLRRDKLVLPSLHSSKVFFVDVGKDPRKPELHTVIDGSHMRSLNCTFPHTAHCLATGEIMISTMGDNEGNGKGEYVLVDAKTLEMTGTWTKGNKVAKFGYDFWYQPYHDVMAASEWGAPRVFKSGFKPSDVEDIDVYGSSINIFKWSTREIQQTINLGPEGVAPLEIRFLHDPKASQGFVGCALYANVYRFFKKDDGSWDTQKVIDIPAKKVANEDSEFELNGLMSDILLSLDDKYIYFSNWLHGDVRQYDISNPEKPRLTGQVFLAGRIAEEGLRVLEDKELKEPPKPVIVRGKRLRGGPQMLQLSLDGKRLYVSCSLYSPWDKQFYPGLVKAGGWVVKLDVDLEKGGIKLDPDFLVDFGSEPNGPVLPHEMRYPGGDCTSDIWLVEDE